MPGPLAEPILIAVIDPVPEIFEIVLDEQFVGPPTFKIMAVMAPEPTLILLNVLPVMFLVGPFAELRPDAFCHPRNVPVPLIVMFEKLLPVSVITEPFTLLPPDV